MSEIHQPPTYRTLQEMFAKQRLILSEYKIREDLPEWPWDLQTKRAQVLLKRFAYRLMEELGEASEQLTLANEYISSNQAEKAEQCIEQYNEELADAWHFFLEILIFSGMDETGIELWVRRKRAENGIFESTLNGDNLLKGLLVFAQYQNYSEGYIRKKRDEFVIFAEPEVFTENPQDMGGRSINEKALGIHDQFFWAIGRQIMTAMNQLKIRDWHTREEKTVNLIKYNEAMMEAFIFFIRLMDYTQKTELSIYNSYMIKNAINWERLQTQ